MSQIDRVLRSNLKLRHLQLLVALDEFRHLGRVSEFLSITQPAVSKMLVEIEHYVFEDVKYSTGLDHAGYSVVSSEGFGEGYSEAAQAREQQFRDIPEDAGGLLRAFILKEYQKNRYKDN